MKFLLVALCMVFASCGLGAQTNAWQPSPGHTQMPIWPGAVPDPQAVPGPEKMTVNGDHPVAGKPWIEVDNVSQPTMTVYRPRAGTRVPR